MKPIKNNTVSVGTTVKVWSPNQTHHFKVGYVFVCHVAVLWGLRKLVKKDIPIYCSYRYSEYLLIFIYIKIFIL